MQLIKLQQRDRALLVLKLKRYREKAASECDGQLMTVLEMINNVEWESSNMDVLRALGAGTALLNKMHEEMPVEAVEDLLDETNAAIEVLLVKFFVFVSTLVLV